MIPIKSHCMYPCHDFWKWCWNTRVPFKSQTVLLETPNNIRVLLTPDFHWFTIAYWWNPHFSLTTLLGHRRRQEGLSRWRLGRRDRGAQPGRSLAGKGFMKFLGNFQGFLVIYEFYSDFLMILQGHYFLDRNLPRCSMVLEYSSTMENLG